MFWESNLLYVLLTNPQFGDHEVFFAGDLVIDSPSYGAYPLASERGSFLLLWPP